MSAVTILFCIGVFFFLTTSSAERFTPFPGCTGEATYEVTFRNLLLPRRFGSKIPAGGLVFSPLAGISHSNRFSVLTVRGYASSEVAMVAKSGNNGPLLEMASAQQERVGFVKSSMGAEGPTLPGNRTTVTVIVDCDHPFITVISMIAPSPDWIVQINNRNMFNTMSGRFTRGMAGTLIAYDAGVDSGRDFTDPSDSSLDLLTMPPRNIAPLVEDDTDRFDGMIVGRFSMRMMD